MSLPTSWALILVLGGLVGAAWACARLGMAAIRRGQRQRAMVMGNLAVLCALVAALWLGLEWHFRTNVLVSDGFNVSLASRAWFDQYWRPNNAKDYRDREWYMTDLEGKKIMEVVGDSFVAGHGIEHVRDRFADRLQERLGDDWAVINVAKNGWNTIGEYKGILNYELQPDVMVLSYYINDIEDAGDALGYPKPRPDELSAGPLQPLVDDSYLANFVYWRLFRFAAQGLEGQYLSYLERLFADPAVWNRHLAELDQITGFARDNDADLIAIVFPDLAQVERTKALTARVSAALAKQGATVLDMGERLAGRDWRSLVVSSSDTHPNVALHAEIADLLYDTLEGGVLPKAPLVAGNSTGTR